MILLMIIAVLILGLLKAAAILGLATLLIPTLHFTLFNLLITYVIVIVASINLKINLKG